MVVSSLTFSNGVKVPIVGLGTDLSKSDSVENLKTALRAALDSGYRHIDTAQVYGTEDAIGDVVAEYIAAGKLTREELFLVTKLPSTHHEPKAVHGVIKQQLKSLQTDYIDLYLIHNPCPVATNADGKVVEAKVGPLDTWRTLEDLYNAKVVRSIGVSNFNQRQIQRILDKGTVPIHNLQIEVHAAFQQHELIAFASGNGITVTAYSPLGSPGKRDANILDHPAVIAIAKKHGKTPGQVCLRLLVQNGIAVIPKSVNPSRIQANIDIFDFELTADDMEELKGLDAGKRLFTMPFCQWHSEFPFHDVREL
uniref:Aldo_ket_red domain-containing protein n=1 Tax=Panagrellus redivivus TaxID=6233 RepID=A0A7E4W4Y7_PANRE